MTRFGLFFSCSWDEFRHSGSVLKGNNFKRKKIFGFIKLGLCLLILGVLWHNDRVSLDQLKSTTNYPWHWLFAFLALFTQRLLVSLRFWLIGQAFGLKVGSFYRCFQLTMVGLLASLGLPGSASGDIAKFFFLRDSDNPQWKGAATACLLTDRLMGLISLVTLGGLILSLVLFAPRLLSIDPNLLDGKLVLGLFVLALGFCTWIAVSPRFFSFRLQKRAPWLRIDQDLKISFSRRLLVIGASLFSQVFLILSFSILLLPIVESLTQLGTILSLTPFALLSLVIPIGPGGAGVGHIAFDQVLGFASVENGASLFNIFWLSNFLVNLTGFYFLLKVKQFKAKA